MCYSSNDLHFQISSGPKARASVEVKYPNLTNPVTVDSQRDISDNFRSRIAGVNKVGLDSRKTGMPTSHTGLHLNSDGARLG